MTSPNPAAPESFDLARFNMIEQQIRPWEVLDARVLTLLGQVRREDFVPQAHRALAFAEFQTHLKGLLDAAGKLGLDRQDLIDHIDQALAGPQDASPSTTEPTHRRTPA